MSYGHYWKKANGFTNEQWEEIKKSVDIAIKHLPQQSTSAGAEYEMHGLCICTFNPDEGDFSNEVYSVNDVLREKGGDQIILFDGDEEAGLDNVPMLLNQYPTKYYGESCKTDRLPYDWLVVAVLAIAKVHAPNDVKLFSDGEAEDIQPVIDWLGDIMPEHNFVNFANNDIRDIMAS